MNDDQNKDSEDEPEVKQQPQEPSKNKINAKVGWWRRLRKWIEEWKVVIGRVAHPLAVGFFGTHFPYQITTECRAVRIR